MDYKWNVRLFRVLFTIYRPIDYNVFILYSIKPLESNTSMGIKQECTGVDKNTNEWRLLRTLLIYGRDSNKAIIPKLTQLDDLK